MKNNVYYFILLFLIVLFTGCHKTYIHNEDSFLSSLLINKIKKAYTKNTSLSNMYFCVNEVDKRKRLPLFSNFINSYADFGFTNGELEWDISYAKLEYPDTSWKLVEINLLNNLRNDTILARSNISGARGKISRRGLVAINSNKEIKFISGSHLNHSIEKDFNLNVMYPDSYLNFVSLKLFNHGYKKIEFLEREGDILTFLAHKMDEKQNLHWKMKWFLNVNNPDILIGGKIIWTKPQEINSEMFLKLPFEGHEDKKSYLLNSLMKNLYLYRCHQIPNLVDQLDLDTISMHYFNRVSMRDNLLPDYDEYMDRIDLISLNLKNTNQNCENITPSFQELGGNSEKSNILYTSFFRDIEFYYIYKDTIETLKSKIKDNFRYDFYYQPEEKLKNEQSLKKVGFPLAPPKNIPELVFNGGSPRCTFYNPEFSEEWANRMDYYLVALDTKTKEVHFISGKNIYLSEVLHLYPPVNKKRPKNVEKWEQQYKLQYIKDRLYQYQVSHLSEEDIIKRDSEKLILNVLGTEYGKKVNLKITLFYNNPETLGIEKI